MDGPTTCVIGAGVCGLLTVKALRDAHMPVTCFEASDDVGGNWYFKNPNGWSSAYRSLHIDISKPSIELDDLPLPDHLPDYPHHSEIHDYLREYAHTFGLTRDIRFRTRVERAERLEDGGWEVALDSGDRERFDRLVVANGHHWDPLYPEPAFPGSFDGRQIHSHDYIDPTDPLDLRGSRVLVVGIGNSGADIASELSRRGVAEQVFISTRSGAWVVPKYTLGRPTDQLAQTRAHVPLTLQRRLAERMLVLLAGRPERLGLPTPSHRFLEAHPTVSSELPLRLGSGDLRVKPDVAELRGTRVRFADGSDERIDAIVYATGYRVSFPFFDPAFLSAPGNALPLYKRIFKPGVDDLAFVGLAQAYPTVFPFAEAQARLVAMWAAGDWLPPSDAEMERAIRRDDRRYLGAFQPRARHTMQHDTRLYVRELRRRLAPEGRRRAAATRAR